MNSGPNDSSYTEEEDSTPIRYSCVDRRMDPSKESWTRDPVDGTLENFHDCCVKELLGERKQWNKYYFGEDIFRLESVMVIRYLLEARRDGVIYYVPRKEVRVDRFHSPDFEIIRRVHDVVERLLSLRLLKILPLDYDEEEDRWLMFPWDYDCMRDQRDTCPDCSPNMEKL